MPAPNKSLDFAIITALDEEFRSACDMLHRGIDINSSPKGHSIKRRKCYLRINTTTYAGMVFQLPAMGRVEAAILLTCILHEWQFRLIAVVGIAGGIPRLVREERVPELGDVVFAETIVDVENRKIIPEGEIDRFKKYSISRELCELFRSFSASYSYKRSYLQTMLRIGYRPQSLPKLHLGSVISGSEVIAHNEESIAIAKRLARSDRLGFPLCVEMEGAGIAICADRLSVSDRIFMVRGISDLADANKGVDEHTWRRYACDNAAFFGAEFIKYVAAQQSWTSDVSYAGRSSTD